jgi:ribonuclease BN (tRNA processing enzyme)
VRLTTIGTGTAAPSPDRVQSATLLEAGAVRLLVDCGGGAVHRMSQLGIDWPAITHVAITHFHADHTTDLANLVHAWRFGMSPSREALVEIIGPPGTADLLMRLTAAFGGSLLDGPPPILVREIAGGDVCELQPGIQLEARKVPHTDESVAYSLLAFERRLVVSGDTGFDPSLAAWAAGADVLVLECSLPDETAIPMHLTPRQCGELAAIARPSLLALTHFYPTVESTDVPSQLREHFDGPLVLASDGWMHEIEET